MTNEQDLPSVSNSTRKELHQQQEASMDRETKVLLKRIEDVKAQACKQFLQMLSVYAGKLDRLRALCAFHLWRLRMLGPEKYSEKATAATSGNIDVLALAKRLAYDAGLQSEAVLRLLFELDGVVGGSDEVRTNRKSLVNFLKTTLIEKFDMIRASAIKLQPFAARLNELTKEQASAASTETKPTEDEGYDVVEVPADDEVDLNSVEVEEEGQMEEEDRQTQTQKEEEQNKCAEEESEEIACIQTDGQDNDDDAHSKMDGQDDDDDDAHSKMDVAETDTETNSCEQEQEQDEDDILEKRVLSLRQRRPDLEYALPLQERSSADGSLLLWADVPGLQDVRVKVDVAKRALHVYGLRHAKRIVRVPVRDMWGMVHSYTRRQETAMEWFQQTLEVPAVFDLQHVKHMSTTSQLRFVLPRQTTARRRQLQEWTEAARHSQPATRRRMEQQPSYMQCRQPRQLFDPFAQFSQPWLF
eukprot:g18933.t1